MKNAARHIAITKEMSRFALIQGLLPEIRRFVVHVKPKTVEDAIREARSAEMTIAASQPDSNDAAVTKQILEQILSKLSSTQTVAAIDQPDTPRRVTFSSTNQDSFRPRSRSSSWDRRSS